MKPFIISKRTPPPPHRGTFDRQLTILALLFAAAAGALLLTACDSPTGDNTNTNGGKVIPPKVTPPKVTPPIVEPPKTYNTTVKGKVVTPARAADPAKGSIITTARVWSSIDPAKKVDVGTDGSYSLQVVNHTGSFTVTAEYTATGNNNYKTSDPKTVSTTGAEVNNQDIPLNYGYTTTVIGAVVTITGGVGVSNPVVGATVVIEVEGIEAGRDTTTAAGAYSIANVKHPGVMTAKVTSTAGNDTQDLTTTNTEVNRAFIL